MISRIDRGMCGVYMILKKITLEKGLINRVERKLHGVYMISEKNHTTKKFEKDLTSRTDKKCKEFIRFHRVVPPREY